MDFFKELLSNYVLNAALLSWFLAQLIKTILTLIFTKKLKLERMFGAGGMPSAHSATVCALVVSMSRTTGVASPEFAIALLFAAVVMYDAMGVRRAAGEHARVINAMLDEWDEQINNFFRFDKDSLKNHPLLSKFIQELSNDKDKEGQSDELKDGGEILTHSDSPDEGDGRPQSGDLEYRPIKHTDARGKEFELDNIELKEFLGHTPLEVLAGALLGIMVALLLPM